MQRDDEQTEKSNDPRSEEWIAAFEKQATQTTFDRARRYARTRARGVAKAGRKIDDYYARELVQDAVVDTFAGVLAWEPARTPLEAHLMSAVRFRTRHDREHALRFRHQAIHDVPEGRDDCSSELRIAEEEASVAVAHEAPSADTYAYAAEVVAALRARAGDDRVIHRILDAYAQGATHKADVMRITGMKAATYHNARIRLGRLVLHLPPNMRPEARAA